MSYLPLCPVKNQSENIKLSNVKKKIIIIISLPTYPPAESVGRQCQTNNILRVALLKFIFLGAQLATTANILDLVPSHVKNFPTMYQKTKLTIAQ